MAWENALDRLVLQQIHLGERGERRPPEIRELVDDVRALCPDRNETWFHVGYAQALELWIADRIVEKQSLTRAFDPVPQAPIGTSGVERGLIAARLRPALTSLSTQGDGRIDLRFDQVDFAQLGAWLSAAHPGWGYRIDSFRLEALQGDGGAEGGSGHISGRVAAWISLSPQDP